MGRKRRNKRKNFGEKYSKWKNKLLGNKDNTMNKDSLKSLSITYNVSEDESKKYEAYIQGK